MDVRAQPESGCAVRGALKASETIVQASCTSFTQTLNDTLVETSPTDRGGFLNT